MEISLVRKTAIVTGAAKGIGRGIALEMARAGAHVVVVDNDEAFGQETVAVVQEEGFLAEFYQMDITDAAAQDRLLEQFTQIDILVNNAGITPEGDFLETSMDEVRRVMDVNFFAGYELTHRVAKQMIERKIEGQILFTTSTHQFVTIMRPAYSTSKAALGMFVKELALALTPEYGIRVNAVAPGVVAVNGEESLQSDMVPMGNMAVPEDIGKAMVFLASDAACHITGHTLVVDGGFSKAHAHFWKK